MRAAWLLVLSLLMAASAGAATSIRIGVGQPDSATQKVGALMAAAAQRPGGPQVKALASLGSVANVNGLVNGQLESAIVLADVATWAQQGSGPFKGKTAVSGLRLLATLFPVEVLLVARKDAAIKSPADLKGKRVGLGDKGGAVAYDVQLILQAWGLKPGDLKGQEAKPSAALDKLRAGELDAVFTIGDAPPLELQAVLARTHEFEVVPITGPQAEALRKSTPFFVEHTIIGEHGPRVQGGAGVRTLAVLAQWVALDKLDARQAQAMLAAVMAPAAAKQLAGVPQGRWVTPAQGMKGATIPLHAGAQAFYREAKLLK